MSQDAFIPQDLIDALLANGQASLDGRDDDPVPAIKLFTPDGAATWLLTELDPRDEDLAFGLCDLGQGFPELGYVRLSEIRAVRGPLGLPVERDVSFQTDQPLSIFARVARLAGRIVT